MLKHRKQFLLLRLCVVCLVSLAEAFMPGYPGVINPVSYAIVTQVANAFNADKGRSGAIRIALALEKQGIHYNRKTVADNLLQQDFTASRPNQKWAGDITYLWTWYYLAVVLDLYSRKVIGWAMSERMKARLVCDALTMALFRRPPPKKRHRAY